MKKMTIDDIARLTGVSKTTVSRVLNNVSGVKEDTKQRVLELVQALDFIPSSFAKGLATNRTKMLGLILPIRGADPFFLNFIGSIEEILCSYGYRLLLSSVVDGWGFQLVKQHVIDGIFLFDIAAHHDERIRILNEMNFPYVALGSSPEDNQNTVFVDIDNEKAGYEGTRHLLELGHRDIIFVSGPKEMQTSFQRLKGFYSAINDAGIIPGRSNVIYGDYTEKSGYHAATQLLNEGRRFSALFCASDSMAIGALMAFRERKIKIPEDVSIVSFDDIPMSKYVDPPLTTIRFLVPELGKQAAKLLIDWIEGEKPSQTSWILPTELIVRKSTAVCKTKNPGLA